MRRISSIPLKTSISIGIRGTGFNDRQIGTKSNVSNDFQKPYKVQPYKRPKKPKQFKIKVDKTKPLFDVFRESENTLKVIGELPGIIDNKDVILKVKENRLLIDNEKQSINLPEDFGSAILESYRINNGILTVLLKGKN